MEFKINNQLMSQLLGRMEYVSKRHDVLATNVAHSETPGFVAKDLEFSGFIEQAEQNEKNSYTVMAKPQVTVKESTAPKNANNNNVNMEQEMAKMTDNSVEYMLATEVIKKHLIMIKFSGSE